MQPGGRRLAINTESILGADCFINSICTISCIVGYINNPSARVSRSCGISTMVGDRNDGPIGSGQNDCSRD